MEHVLLQILGEIQELRKGQASLNQKVDKNFNELNGKYSNLDQKSDDLNGKYSNLDQKSDDLIGKYSNLDQKFDDLNGKYSNLDRKFDDLNGKYSNLDQKFDKNFNILNNKIDKLSEQIRSHHIENIHADEHLLNEIISLKTNVTFINRKIADAELEINALKRSKQ
ncbi:hypothetical protein [Cytobacillus massiliigabonensis]|uniref:hypothetical protein n=1 Tax=Cytobacillus massiliigabonensis TaxID=1871011 RepID=UPI000C83D4C7|nr:hypothetical protein [Cytobacillus massiliigabonensis]